MTTNTSTVEPRSRRRSRRNRRGWLWFIPIVPGLVGAGAWYIYFRPAETVAEVATGPQTVAVFPQLYRETVSGTGILEPFQTLELGFDVSDTVIELAEVGQRVSVGDVIARLDTTSFERSVRDAEFALQQAQTRRQSTASSQSDSAITLEESIRSAELSLQDAQREVERSRNDLSLKQQLQAVGGESVDSVQLAQDAYNRALDNASKAQLNLETLRESQVLRSDANVQDLRNADLTIQASELSLERAQEDLAATSLIAPFDGVIAALSVSEGNSVSSSASVLTLIDDTQVKLEAQIDETEISLVSLGLAAEVELDAISDQVFTGQVTTISPVARVVSNIPVFDVMITLDNSSGLMRPGMTAEAEILIQEVEGTFSVPSGALQSVRNRNYVQVADEDGEPALHPVRVVTTSGLNTIVTGDLSPGAEVLLPEVAIEESTTSNTVAPRGTGIPFLGGPSSR